MKRKKIIIGGTLTERKKGQNPPLLAKRQEEGGCISINNTNKENRTPDICLEDREFTN